MTEAEYLAAKGPEPLLNWLIQQRRLSDRKARLFAAACCHRIVKKDSRLYFVVVVAERRADGVATDEELQQARHCAQGPSLAALLGAADLACSGAAEDAARLAARAACTAAEPTRSRGRFSHGELVSCPEWTEVHRRERGTQAEILRHLVGNPFAPQSVRQHVPEVVLRLAEALYQGTDCAAALHDALLDAGLGDLATHFCNLTEVHPKGCYVLDLLLGRS